MNNVAIRLKKLFLDSGLSREVTAGLLGNIEVECNFKPTKESLKYSSVARIKAVFPSKVKGMTDSQIQKLVMNEKALGDLVYKEYGGFLYRGRGFIQITGKQNYDKFGKLIGVDLVKNPDLACDEMIAGKIAVEYVKQVAIKKYPNLNSNRNSREVFDIITKSIQGFGKDYSKGFLKEHLEKKRKASEKYL